METIYDLKINLKNKRGNWARLHIFDNLKFVLKRSETQRIFEIFQPKMYSPYSFQVPISLIWQETVCLIAYSPVYLYRKTTHKKLHLKIIVTISLPRIEVSHSEEQMIILPRRLLEYFIGIGMKSLNIKRDMDSV